MSCLHLTPLMIPNSSLLLTISPVRRFQMERTPLVLPLTRYLSPRWTMTSNLVMTFFSRFSVVLTISLT